MFIARLKEMSLLEVFELNRFFPQNVLLAWQLYRSFKSRDCIWIVWIKVVLSLVQKVSPLNISFYCFLFRYPESHTINSFMPGKVSLGTMIIILELSKKITFLSGELYVELWLTLILLVVIFAITKWGKNAENDWNPGILVLIWVLSESYIINSNMTGFRWFTKILASLCFGRK